MFTLSPHLLLNSSDLLQNCHDPQSIYKVTKACILQFHLPEIFSWIPLMYSLIFNIFIRNLLCNSHCNWLCRCNDEQTALTLKSATMCILHDVHDAIRVNKKKAILPNLQEGNYFIRKVHSCCNMNKTSLMEVWEENVGRGEGSGYGMHKRHW